MSVLLVGLDPQVAAAVTRRLIAQGDQVRVIASPAGPAPEGAYVATGDAGDDDLVERAAQGCRTIVIGTVSGAVRAAALTGAGRAGVGRAVLLGDLGADAPASMSWVALVTPGRGLLGRRRALDPDALAEAVDAADDLAGEPRLVADLATEEGWRALRLEPPGSSRGP
ncbi:MAG: SDR family oxidoreductase [Actinomycetota bacterium]|nr:SDR family oxidoreductase [Actinomycetota bacterium]